jgi:arylsulfatase
VGEGIIDPSWELSPRDPGVPAWEEEQEKEWQARRMEVYAAQIDCMDQGIGRVLAALEETGQLENTLILFLADNGGCHEEIRPGWAPFITGHVGRSRTRDGREVRIGNSPDIRPGGEETYTSCGVPWANLQNTPFRWYKHWVHEGGISTPLIVHWPAGLDARGKLRHQAGQLPDIMATLLDVSGAAYPEGIPPCEGVSLLPAMRDPSAPRPGMLFWEHEGNAAVREGRWKLVRNWDGVHSAVRGYEPPQPHGSWELYDIEKDRSELHDLAAAHPEVVARLSAAWEAWAARCGVMDRDELLAWLRARRG